MASKVCTVDVGIRGAEIEDIDGERARVDDRDGSEASESGYDRKGGISIDCKDVRLLGILLCCWVYDV